MNTSDVTSGDPQESTARLKFCDDDFWDSNLTWNNSWPQLSNCFQSSLLSSIPCVYLIIFWPVYFSVSLRHGIRTLKVDQLFCFKMICSCTLILTEIFNLIYELTNITSLSPLIASSSKLFCYILVAATTVMEQKTSTLNSPGIFIFFLLLLLTHIVPFYSRIILQEYSTKAVSFVIFYINYTALLCMGLLHCFNHNCLNVKPLSVEEEATILSRFTLEWITRMVIKGYKKPLTEKEIFPLKSSEKSGTVVPKFLHFFGRFSEIYRRSTTKCSMKKVEKSTRYEPDDIKDSHERPPLLNEMSLKEITKNDTDITDHDEIQVNFLSSHSTQAENQNGKGMALVLWKVILRTFWKQVVKCCLLGQLAKIFTLIGPLFLKLLIDFTSQEDEPNWHGYLLATALFLTSVMSQIIYEYYLYQCNVTGIRVRASVVSAIYRKTLSLSSEARQSSSSGEIIQLLSKDVDTIWIMVDEGFVIPESPTELLVGLIMVYYTVGVAMFSGLAALVFLFIMKLLGSHKQTQCEEELRVAADERMKITSQVFSGIKVLKLYAWEEAFKALMNSIRKKELWAVFKFNLFRFFTTFAWTGAVFWMTFFTFLTYVLVDESHHLTASTVFVTISYLNFVRRASNCFTYAVDYVIAGMVSSRRVMNFLTLKEMIRPSQFSSCSLLSKDTSVMLSDASLSWSHTSDPILKQIMLEVPKGSLVAVVGMVGCGKSSLLSAILGEMVVQKGVVQKQGSIAYIPQEAWIQNDTLCNNILFGSDLNEEKYREVIQACALKADLAILPAGDQTEIGEKGINLSGGQKQRVSLARAVYQESDVYLLDDPLSAVDSHVGRHIFDHVIGRQGLLKDKTRILVTHGIQWLPEVDKVVVLTNGQITEMGLFDQLMAHNGPFAQFLSQYLLQQRLQAENNPNKMANGHGDTGKLELETDEFRKAIFTRLLSIESQKSGDGSEDHTDLENLKNKSDCTIKEILHHQLSIKDEGQDVGEIAQKIIDEEEVAGGRVNWSVYKTFLQSMGYMSVCVLSFLFLLCFVFELVAGFWLSFWVDDPLLNNMSIPADSLLREQENMFYMSVYSVWGILETLIVVIFTIIKAYRHKHVANVIHERLITSVLASPIQFFDTTPVGRVLSRVSKDINVVDLTLVLFMEIWLHSIFAVLCMIVVIIITIPMFLAVAIPTMALFYFIEKLYLPTSCQLRRLERKCLSPVFSHASESYAGASVIRALGQEDRFIQTADERIDVFQSMTLASLACERWLSMRLGLLSDLLVLFAALLAVTYKDELSPGLIGLSLSMALTVTSNMQLQVRVASLLEMDIVSVERILQYIDLPSEAPRHLPCPGFSPEWPTVGEITFRNVCARYRPGLEMILKGISFHVHDGEKIGVVGRTGAGKSSLMLVLFRLVEPCQGQIIIDGIDVSKLGLYDLRQKLTILPQDPVLFTGTLRTNLDPFGKSSDKDIWKALDHCHLKNFVEKLTEGLDFQVGEGGNNLSIGQRQLMCLGRALLRKTKILVLDEATAAVDVETDELIQKTIRSEFKACTVLTIAHRLNTIMDYDRILVLDNGMIVEFDAPSVLMSNAKSLFYKMSVESHTLSTS
ncbi:unnamed protein product [Lymnaea stagnalis]|uniref:Multidrug resistance-associated protein 1-like n=1 Tax=Lymnaea stagnalis TaxID=6523 RepID=A0AAV2H406_LYMST